MESTVYIKLNKSSCVEHCEIRISDIASVFCQDRHMEAKIKALKVMKLEEGKSRRYVISIMKVVEIISRQYPQVTVESEGEPDAVVEHSNRKGKGKITEFVKVALICLITMLGGAFAIMAYNNDMGSAELFARIYESVLGEGAKGHMILEASYSIGLAVGIIVFYGHFGSWKFGKDPTPLEVEMRLYEDQVDTAIIKQSEREAVELDAD